MKSAIRPFVRFWLIKRPLRPLAVQDPSALRRSETCFGKPVRPPPSAKTTEASAREAVAESLAVNGARASDGAGLPWLSRKLRPSPGKLFREATGQLPAPKLRKRARATRPSEAVADASTVAQKVFLGSPTGPTPASKRRKRAFGQPDGPNLR